MRPWPQVAPSGHMDPHFSSEETETQRGFSDLPRCRRRFLPDIFWGVGGASFPRLSLRLCRSSGAGPLLLLASLIFPQRSPEEAQTKAGSWGPGRLTLEVPAAPSAHGLGIQLGPQSHSRVTQPEASGAEEALFWGLRSLASSTDTLTDLRHCQALGGLTLSSAASAHLADHCLPFPVQIWKQLF